MWTGWACRSFGVATEVAPVFEDGNDTDSPIIVSDCSRQFGPASV